MISFLRIGKFEIFFMIIVKKENDVFYVLGSECILMSSYSLT